MLSAPPAGTDLGASPFAVDEQSAYFLDGASTRILRLPLSGGAPTPLTGDVGFEGYNTGVLAATGGAVYATVPYATYGGTLFARYGLGDAGPAAVDAIVNPQAAALDADGSIFVAAVSTAGAPAGEYAGTAVWRYDTTSGATRLVACGPTARGTSALLAYAVAVDASNVYVAFLAAGDISHWVLMRAPR